MFHKFTKTRFCKSPELFLRQLDKKNRETEIKERK